jgi:polysaccharide export outer membrane protein
VKRLLLFLVITILSFSSQTAAETSSSDIYKIGINDVLSITVLDNEELNTMASVTADGTITLPFIGVVNVKGMSLSEIDETITRKFSEGYIKYPVVTVSLVQSMSRKIYIYGELIKRGQVIFEDGLTIIKALSLVGGVSHDGLFGKLKVRRKRGDSNEYVDLVEADINNGFINDRKKEDMLLKPDDILIVERNKTFLIQGDTAQHGRMVLEKNMTVLRALLQAGGVTENGLYGNIKVRRKQEGSDDAYKDLVEANINKGVIESSEVEDMVLKPDDILIIERNKTFMIYGEVTRTGEFVLEDNMSVFKALTVAGGFTKWGSANRVKILRPKNDEIGFEIIKVNVDDVIKGDANVDITLKSGDTIIVSSGVF